MANAGLVGVIPAMGIMTVEQNPPDGPVILSYGQLILWSLALAFLGVFCAVPLRTQTILKEKLKFPSGTATANVIRTLHAVPNHPQTLEHLHTVHVIQEEPGKSLCNWSRQVACTTGNMMGDSKCNCSMSIHTLSYDAVAVI